MSEAPEQKTPPIRILLAVAPIAFAVMVTVGIVATATLGGETQGKTATFVLRAEDVPARSFAGGQGAARILVDQAVSERASLTDILLAPGAEIPPRIESDQDGFLYVYSGVAKVTLRGRQRAARAGDAVHIPAGYEHAVLSAGRLKPLRAVLFYVGPGPEQRFADGDPVPME